MEILIFRQGRIANPPERERENVPICRPQQEDSLAIYKAEEDFYGLEILIFSKGGIRFGGFAIRRG